MKRYKVLKDYVHPKTLELIKTGYEFSLVTEQVYNYMDALEREGFIEEIPEQLKTVWDLEEDDEYWVITKFGHVDNYWWHDDENDNLCRETGNMFLTKEDAEKELARRKAKEILKRDTKGFKPNWHDCCQDKWIVYRDESNGLLKTTLRLLENTGGLLFATEDDAEASIKAHEKEWLYYLGIEG